MAGSPGGREVSRLAVKVLPDTSEFGTRLQTYLDRIERRAKVGVKVVPDTSKFSADLRDDLAQVRKSLSVQMKPSLRGFRTALRDQLKAVRATVSVEAVPDTSEFSAKLTTKLAAIRERVKVAADPDLTDFRTTLETRLSRVRAELKVKIKPDLRGFRTEVNAIVRGLKLRPIRVLVRPTLDLRAYNRIRAQLRALGRPITVRIRTTGDNIPSPNAGSIGGGGSGGGGGIGRVAALATAVASMIPQLSSLIASLLQTGPALAVAATGLLALVSAGAALAIGLNGVGKALGGDAKALADLAPAARNFVSSVRAMAPAWKALRLDVQERLFKGLGGALTKAAKTALPVLREQLGKSATALNAMGKGVLTTSRTLASDGTLGKALDGANKGLSNLSNLPSVIVQGLVQVGAAAAPAFDRLTKRAGSALDRLADKMTKSFASGAMERAIERAISVVKKFLAVGKNIGGIFKNVFGTAAEAGGSFLDTLLRTTGALKELTATAEVQGGLRALFSTLATVSSTGVMLLGEALKTLGPAVQAVAPHVQGFVKTVGESLKPVFEALSPVLKTAGEAIGSLFDSVSSLLPVFGDLIALLGPVVQPVFDMLKRVFAELKPVMEEVGGILRDILTPVLEKLPGIVQPVADAIGDQLVQGLRFLKDLLVELRPSLAALGEDFAKLVEELKPVILLVTDLSKKLVEELRPYLPLVAQAIGLLAKFLAEELGYALNLIVIPALRILVDILRGDFSKALDRAKQAVARIVTTMIQQFQQLPARAGKAIAPLAGKLVQAAEDSGKRFGTSIIRRLDDGLMFIARFPGRAQAAMGRLGGVLVGAGVDLIAGFLRGIQSMIPSVRGALFDLTAKLTQWKGPPKKDAKILTPAGRSLITGFIRGIDGTTAQLRSRLQSITKALPANVRSGYGKTLKKATDELNKLITKRDGVIKKLSAAEKKLADLQKAREDVRKGVVSGILGEGDLTKMIVRDSSVSSLTQNLKDYAKQVTAFAANIAKLRKLGLDADIIRQIADAGLSGGGATAALLAKSSSSQIKELNKAQAALERAAGTAGNTAADALYKAGIDSAKGLVKGLESQQGAIEKQMIKIAKSMEAAIKKALGIRSPARKMIPVGRDTARGVDVGLVREIPTIEATMRRLVPVPRVASSSISADVASTVSRGGSGLGEAVRSGGPLVAIENFQADSMTPAEVARELEWRMKRRG
ncbi:hypothetical protein [Streptomyces scopuliridis]|uniref:hypothetical protein n=1 Tax=Streptomyces scopuliridis TaxID=452529 RepID=UPI0036B2D53E